jgi:hypothetical protein
MRRHAFHRPCGGGSNFIDKAEAGAQGCCSLDAAARIVARVAAERSDAFMKNGLYSIHLDMLDGVRGRNSGVMVLRDGAIRGGDAFFYYVGHYSFADGRWRGELINREHTPSGADRPVFGGREVGIGFSGSYGENGAEAEATALAGKRSIRFRATLRRLVDA